LTCHGVAASIPRSNGPSKLIITAQMMMSKNAMRRLAEACGGAFDGEAGGESTVTPLVIPAVTSLPPPQSNPRHPRGLLSGGLLHSGGNRSRREMPDR